MFPVTITINTPQQLAAVISILNPEGVKAKFTPKDEAQTGPQQEVARQSAQTGSVSDKPAKDAAPSKPVQEKALPEKPAQEKPAQEKPAELSYDQVAAVVSRYAGRDRKGALSILETHGLTSFRDAKVEQFAAIHKDFTAALAASAH